MALFPRWQRENWRGLEGHGSLIPQSMIPMVVLPQSFCSAPEDCSFPMAMGKDHGRGTRNLKEGGPFLRAIHFMNIGYDQRTIGPQTT